jgi:hypothetical protein
MATQKQAEQRADDLLDQLDDVNEKLDIAEDTKKKEKSNTAKHMVRNIGLCALGICIGLGIHSVVGDVAGRKQPSVSDAREQELFTEWGKQTYSINGASYTINSTLGDYEKNGWTVDTTNATPASIIQPDQYIEIKLLNGSYTLDYVTIRNNEDSAIPVEQCQVSDISVYNGSTKAICTAPFGIKEGMTKQEVAAKLDEAGLPYGIDKESYGTTYNHSINGDKDNHFVSYSVSSTFMDNYQSVSFSMYESGVSLYAHF